MDKELQRINDIDFKMVERYNAFLPKVRDMLAEYYYHVPLLCVQSFGCQQNFSDSEKIMGAFKDMGFEITEDLTQADFIIFNTCAIRELAELKVFSKIGELKKLKEENENLVIGMCGCMVQEEKTIATLSASYPYVEFVFGPNAIWDLPELVFKKLSDKGVKILHTPDEEKYEIAEGLPSVRENGVAARLSIMQGCNNFCTYCIVPYVRGRERSRSFKSIVNEAKDLVAAGYKEITLLGQNVNSYGKTLEEPTDFAALLRALNAIPGEFIIRFMTSHPKDCTPQLIDTIAECEKIERHIHLPVQCGSNAVLKAMNRGYTAEHYMGLVMYARQKMPDVLFSSDIIVGFPGETRAEFLETYQLVKELKAEKLFTFIYSPRTGTKAADYADNIPKKQKTDWLGELIDLQGEISEQIHKNMLGKTYRVLIEDVGRKDKSIYIAKTSGAVTVTVKTDKDVLHRFADVKITAAHKHGVEGIII